MHSALAGTHPAFTGLDSLPCYNSAITEVVVAKKWYSYFVVTDASTDVADPAAAAGVPPATEPQRVTDVVPDAEAAATLTGPVQQNVDLSEV